MHGFISEAGEATGHDAHQSRRRAAGAADQRQRAAAKPLEPRWNLRSKGVGQALAIRLAKADSGWECKPSHARPAQLVQCPTPQLCQLAPPEESGPVPRPKAARCPDP